MSSFVGGKLKLKGGVGAVKKDKRKRKRKEKNAKQDDDHRLPTINEDAVDNNIDNNNNRNDSEKPSSLTRDTRTDAEKRFEERQKKLEEERLRKAASLSHKEKVKAFYERLASQSEHNDLFRTSYTA